MGNTPYNVLGVQHKTHVFLIWSVWACASAIACFSHPGLFPSLSRAKVPQKSDMLTNKGHKRRKYGMI